MPLPEPRDELPEQVNLADADAVEPNARSGARPQESAACEFTPDAATVFAGGEGFVEEPGGESEQQEKVQQVEKI
jgi:hypothetical protein